MAKVRKTPPSRLGGVEVVLEDLLPDADVVRLTGDGVRVVVRPSGTEPKLKAYLQVVTPVTNSLPDARGAAQERLTALRADVEELLA
jgi:phosphomannomutase